MSGCLKTSTIGTSPSPTQASTVRSSPIRRARSARKPERASTKSSFPNSDGWNWNGPMSIHRFEPRFASASTKTSTISETVPT